MSDLIDLSQRSGLGISTLLRAFRGGVDPVILSFALWTTGRSVPKGLLSPEVLQGWVERDHFTQNEVDLLCAELLKDWIEEVFAGFGVVGANPEDRDQGTGFGQSD